MKISNVALIIAYLIMIFEYFINRFTDVPYIFCGIALVCICIEHEFLKSAKGKSGAE
jgi:hypothetical protein